VISRCASRRTVCARPSATWPRSPPSSAKLRRAATSRAATWPPATGSRRRGPERRGLLRRLAGADADQEAEAIRRRLDLVAGAINGLRAQLRDLRLRTNYAVVLISLQAADNNQGGAAGSFDDAIGDAGALLVGAAGVLIRVLAWTLPLALIGAAAWLTSAWLRRRRRESALV
jgi:hypothetical protein